MIIKSHIRGGYRSAADYLKSQGKNEKIRTVEISDTEAANLDEAFQGMWKIASNSKVKKPLHHISINPFWDERLTDEQVLKIVERCEQKYGYKSGDHQRVIVEHIRDGRQHFHVMWNRVSMTTGKAVWPGHHWNKSKQAAREMEKELGLKRPLSRREKRMRDAIVRAGKPDSVKQGQIFKNSKTNRIDFTNGPNITGQVRVPTVPTPAARSEKQSIPAPVQPISSSKKWPEAAVIDWEVWGHLDPAKFYSKWPELMPEGFTPFGTLHK